MKKTNINTIDYFAQIVNNIRAKGLVTDLQVIDNVTIITTSDVSGLLVGDYISIGDRTDIKVLDIDYDNNTFTIPTQTLPFFPESWIANKPYYHFDYYDEQAAKLTNIDKSTTKQKYPLVFLLLDIEEQRDADALNYYTIPNITIIIACHTDKTKNQLWRHENTFANILRPLETDLINELNRNFHTLKEPNEKIQFTRKEIFNRKNQFNDFVDAIELNISNLQIKRFINC